MEEIRLKKEEDTLFTILNGYGLDHEWAIYTKIIEICGLNMDAYIEDESQLTKELLEEHYDGILKDIPQNNLNYEHHLQYMVLGALILKIRAELSDDLRDKIIKSADWEFELKKRWRSVDDEFLERRKKTLINFKERLKEYEIGKKIDVNPYIIKGSDDFEAMEKIIKACKLGSLEDLNKEILEENIDKIINVIGKEPPFDIYDYLILGALILKTGAKFPRSLKKKIMEIADWKEERKQKWTLVDEQFLKKRRHILSRFQDMVLNYKSPSIS